MNPRPLRAGAACRSLVLAALAALLCPGAGALADTVAPASSDAEAHAKLCKCASRCHGDSCCCGRSFESRSTKTEPVRASTSSDPGNPAGQSPCLREAPCGDPALPVSTASVSTPKFATSIHHLQIRPALAGVLLAPPASNALLTMSHHGLTARPGPPARLDLRHRFAPPSCIAPGRKSRLRRSCFRSTRSNGAPLRFDPSGSLTSVRWGTGHSTGSQSSCVFVERSP